MAASKPIQIILARQLASCIAAPILLVDAEGTLVFYNEAAEEIFNQRFDETGRCPPTSGPHASREWMRRASRSRPRIAR
jgi:PAS domain-containing protein